MDKTIQKILEIVTETQEELHDFRTEVKEDLRHIRKEVAEVRRDLEHLKERVAGMVGYSKEIDLLMVRVAKIEKHIGVSK